ncbi:hypothetical protein AVEN_248743-1 [Araneus ventricosus]|uniref:Uncharacterized protein n=1 Tax=Araneus ventricosus TaxID=182803 RepID=A0A4Y2UXF7_ARAVE|nr:hypothetical protein AVEN_248743-1 [Araneus ventricosus]
MNSGHFPSSKKRLGKIRFTTDTPSLTPARPKIRLARTEPTKPGGAGVVVRVLNIICRFLSNFGQNPSREICLSVRGHVNTITQKPEYLDG